MEICLFRSLKVIGTDTDRLATYDFLLMFRSNYSPISYRFRDKCRYSAQLFSPPCIKRPPLRGSSWNFVTASAEKSRTMPLSERLESVAIRPFVFTEYWHWTDKQTDRGTDRQTDRQNW